MLRRGIGTASACELAGLADAVAPANRSAEIPAALTLVALYLGRAFAGPIVFGLHATALRMVNTSLDTPLPVVSPPPRSIMCSAIPANVGPVTRPTGTSRASTVDGPSRVGYELMVPRVAAACLPAVAGAEWFARMRSQS